MNKKLIRCAWSLKDPLYIDYHDHEWGVPIHDDKLLFEFLILEGMQAGLSWLTILKKRENFRKAFDNFNAEKIARYSDHKIEKLMMNAGIIRNYRKITATIQNAKAYLNLKDEKSDFSQYIWKYVDDKPIQNNWKNLENVPASTPISDALAKDLKKKGFNFVGTSICYAFMQAVGMVNDHVVSCYRHAQIKRIKP